ncbi:hypothetical protein [Chryseobacterium daeguense]|nr:hypothetical protein [Chryseobacterium daeguense]
MRSILKLLLATAICMILCSCPAGTYIKLHEVVERVANAKKF